MSNKTEQNKSVIFSMGHLEAKEEQNSDTETINTVTLLEYKGILFDDWTIDTETGGIWGEMCQCCAEKYGEVLEQELSLGGIGACSVNGCSEVGYDNDAPGHYYVDFDPSFVTFVQRKREQKPDIDAQINRIEEKGHFTRAHGEPIKRVSQER